MRILRFKSDDNRLIEQVRGGDETAAQRLYHQYEQAFFQWVRKTYPRFPEAEIADIYQESFITFYYQLKDGKVKEIQHSIKTYLFAIGKNVLRNALRKQAKFVDNKEDKDPTPEMTSLDMDDSLMETYQKEHQASIVRQLLDKIGDPCKTVMELAFFRRFSPEAIAAHMGYATEATARVRKVRCLNQLGKLLDTMGIHYEHLFE